MKVKVSRKYAILMTAILVVSFVIGVAVAPGNGPFEELWQAIFGIQEDVEDIQSEMDLLARIAVLEATVEDLEARLLGVEGEVNILEMVPGPQGPPGPQGEQGPTGPQGPPGGFDAPDYDSGWRTLNIGYSNWDTGLPVGSDDNWFVFLMGRSPESDTHQQFYGGTAIDGSIDLGVHWSSRFGGIGIDFWRGPDDPNWHEARVLIWILPEPPSP